MPEPSPVPGSLEWTAARLPYCHLCGNVNPAEVGPLTGMCHDGRACRRRQAGLEPVNPDRSDDAPPAA